ncbi:hypothetical protein NG791_25110 [Laspinema sp. D1]|uniref:hypothetical protein n=1 Tax=Laspinema palackyanum TaxID=3231601 RepID=UPI0034903233|nr:hypothetical protein [Laspinema sp. D2b]
MNYLKLYEKLKGQGVGALPTETLKKISQLYLKNLDRKTEVILWAYLAYQMDSFHKKCAYPSDLGYYSHPCWCLFGNSHVLIWLFLSYSVTDRGLSFK